MSWDNDQRGPWGKPRGQGPEPKKQNPDIDRLLRRGKDSFNGMFNGGDGMPNRKAYLAVGLIIVLLWLASGIYRVNPDELGIVMRFGKYHDTTEPGLNFHLPYPVETVLIPRVTSVNKIEVGYRSGLGDRNNSEVFDRESLMLTRDRNIIDISFEVQWKIDYNAPEDFLFNVRDAASIVKPVAESAMREVIGRNVLEDILTTAQSQIADDTKQLMQQMLDSYKAGIEVIAINLSKPDVPRPVIDEFQDVKRAEQDRATAESVAQGYRNDILPKAQGEAVKMQQDALAYKARVVAEATGDAARFASVYEEYKNAKDVTRKRIYLETMETIMRDMPKVIIDQKNGVMPFLPLPAMKQAADDAAKGAK